MMRFASLLPAMALVAVTRSPGTTLIERTTATAPVLEGTIDLHGARSSGAANVFYNSASDGSFSLTAETEVSGTITIAPAPLVVNKVQLAPSWSCQQQSVSGMPIRYQCIQQGVPTATTISGSGSVTIKNAFGTTGNNGTATFSFSCGQVKTKGCSGTISVKMPKLAQG